MKVQYDPSVDAAYIRFREGKVEVRTVRVTEAVAVDLGPDDEVYGVEVLDAARNLGLRPDVTSVQVDQAQPNSVPHGPGAARQKHSRPYERWSREELALLEADFRAGKTVDELAERLGRQPSAVESRLRKLGLSA